MNEEIGLLISLKIYLNVQKVLYNIFVLCYFCQCYMKNRCYICTIQKKDVFLSH